MNNALLNDSSTQGVLLTTAQAKSLEYALWILCENASLNHGQTHSNYLFAAAAHTLLRESVYQPAVPADVPVEASTPSSDENDVDRSTDMYSLIENQILREKLSNARDSLLTALSAHNKGENSERFLNLALESLTLALKRIPRPVASSNQGGAPTVGLPSTFIHNPRNSSSTGAP